MGEGQAHLQGVALIFVSQEVRAGEGDVVCKDRWVMIDAIAICQDDQSGLWTKVCRNGILENMSFSNSLQPFSKISTECFH